MQSTCGEEDEEEEGREPGRTLATVTPGVCCTSLARRFHSGASCWHGPHHGA